MTNTENVLMVRELHNQIETFFTETPKQEQVDFAIEAIKANPLLCREYGGYKEGMGLGDWAVEWDDYVLDLVIAKFVEDNKVEIKSESFFVQFVNDVTNSEYLPKDDDYTYVNTSFQSFIKVEFVNAPKMSNIVPKFVNSDREVTFMIKHTPWTDLLNGVEELYPVVYGPETDYDHGVDVE